MNDPTDAYLSAIFKLSLKRFSLDVDFQAGPEMVVIFGPSGAGKSLLLQSIAGLRIPDEGRIQIGNRVLYDSAEDHILPPQARRVGYVPQHYALFPHISVVKNISFGLQDLAPADREKRTRELLELMRLADHADKKPADVSGGQQQRVALARALAIRPDILLMDEPFSALDENLRAHLRDELLNVQEAFGIPVILVTHNLEEAYTLADRVVIMVDGKVVQNDARDTVFRKPDSPEIAGMMGMSNILQVRIQEETEGLFRADWNGCDVFLPPSGWMRPGMQITLGIRPEEVMIVRRQSTPSDEHPETLLFGELVSDKAMGYDHELKFAISPAAGQATNHLFVRIPHPIYLRLGLEVGAARSLSIKPAAFQVFPPHE
jgi:molybdate transport system ATP-binding protein